MLDVHSFPSGYLLLLSEQGHQCLTIVNQGNLQNFIGSLGAVAAAVEAVDIGGALQEVGRGINVRFEACNVQGLVSNLVPVNPGPFVHLLNKELMIVESFHGLCTAGQIRSQGWKHDGGRNANQDQRDDDLQEGEASLGS